MLLLESISSDINIYVGETREKSHFLKDNNTIAIEKFLKNIKNAKTSFLL